MNYWLNLFDVRTWEEFQKAGSSVSGFTKTRQKYLEIVRPGDVFLCYVITIMRWVGALEVLGPSNDQRQIWKDYDYPVRFDVKVIVRLTPEYGIPMKELEGKVSFFQTESDKRGFRGRIRESLGKTILGEDGIYILKLLKDIEKKPVFKPFELKKPS